MLGEDGGKMSKSKRNYREPGEIFDRYGADALRWYFFPTSRPGPPSATASRPSRTAFPNSCLRLWNVYSFFVIYANIDKFDPAASISAQAGQLTSEVLATAKGFRPIENRAEIDRWILSELNQHHRQGDRIYGRLR